MIDKINGKELVCISCRAGHVVLNEWVISRTTEVIHCNKWLHYGLCCHSEGNKNRWVWPASI